MLPDKWLWRGWFGILLFIGCEVIFWRSPLDRPVLDGVRLVVGYGVMGAIMLDLLARYRVRDLAGVLGTVLCIVPVIALVLTSENTLMTSTTHLFSRVLGLHALGVLWAFGVWVGLWDKGYSLRWMGGVSVLIGMLSAIWIQVADDFNHWSVSSADRVEAFLMYGLVGCVIGLGGYLARRYPHQSADEMLLSSFEWGMMIFVSMGLMLWADALPSREAISGVVIISGLGALMIWFEHHAKSQSLLNRLLMQSPPDMRRIMTLWFFAGVGLVIGWLIPLNVSEALSPVGILEIGIVLFGFSWMPVLMLWVAVRALSRRSWRLDAE